MGICPVCETISDTYKCNNCGFDKSKDYIHYRSICLLTENERKNFKASRGLNNNTLRKEILNESTDFLSIENMSCEAKKEDNVPVVEIKHREHQSLFSSVRKKIENLSKGKDNSLLEIVNANSLCTKDECQAIYKLGKRKIRDKEYQLAVKIIRYTVQHGYKEANFLLAYCYEQGIGVKRDVKIAEAYYRQGIISNYKYAKYQEKYGYANKAFDVAKKEGEMIFRSIK